MVTHSSMLAWEIPWTEKPGGLQSMGSQRVRPDLVTNTHTETPLLPYIVLVSLQLCPYWKLYIFKKILTVFKFTVGSFSLLLVPVPFPIFT